MSVKIRAVVFDCDGLMFNTEEIFHEATHTLLRRRGKVPTAEMFHQMMGRRAEESFQVLIDHNGLDETFESIRVEYFEIFFALIERSIAPMPGLLELLDHLEVRNLPKGVATSSERSYLQKLLGRFELTSRFHMMLTAEDVTRGKPNPEIYLRAAELLEVEPAEMLVLEDSEAGTRAAAAAGAHIISVPHEHSRHQDFSSARAMARGLHDPVIRSLLEA
ncbi:Phosphorylated carbohydrates phosphatase [Maioricimonas rarisocia]|uniref:Phosphorylated carbohydrates phosphatase n=1 Tax=Maioricimonas rarisocia TaxID=2528026 RepID=A0A517ZCS9_9PLAN|nr:HAD family phosphatase [Maioricimonas rarisocia]QDU40262.1 Phosphorylated carbohydrates phosphatase [Maioricimonas rarisocia]